MRSVAEGVFKLHGKHDDRRVVLLAQSRHLANGLGLNERRVAGEHHDGAVEAGQGIGGGQHRIRRAALGLLHDDLGIAFHQRDHLSRICPTTVTTLSVPASLAASTTHRTSGRPSTS